MPMDVTGGALFAPWWRSSLTTGWSASGKWAAGASRAKTPFAHSNQLCLVGIPADWRNSGSALRSEEHTSELQSRGHLVCRLLLEKKNNKNSQYSHTRHLIDYTSIFTYAGRISTWTE